MKQKGGFNGTIFRFPFRIKANKLSATCYTSQHVDQLFETFLVDAPRVLLFLSNIEKVELHVRKRGMKQAVTVCSVALSEQSRLEVSKARSTLKKSIQSAKWLN